VIRLVLVLVCLAVLAGALWGMWVGWRHRAGRQREFRPLPEPAAELGCPIIEGETGLYVGTTSSRSWQDRIVVHGLGRRAAATATLFPAGLVIDRVRDSVIYVPAASIIEGRLAPALAGKVVGAGGLLVVRWRLGDWVLDTGFRADDERRYPEWLRAIAGLVHA
jgi:hypothetical protein